MPAVLFIVLLGLDHATVDAIFVGRLAGAALLAIGIASWTARIDTRTPTQIGLLTGILVYNAAATLLLAYAGAVLKMMGVLLWPTVVIRAILSVWCFGCLRPESLPFYDPGVCGLFAVEGLGFAMNDCAAFLDDDLGCKRLRAVFARTFYY